MRATVTPFASNRISSLRRLFFTASIGISNECVYKDTTIHRVFQGVFHFFAIETKDGNLHAFLGVVDPVDQRFDAILRLDNQFHAWLLCNPLSLSAWMQDGRQD